jgi:hypothetical protein
MNEAFEKWAKAKNITPDNAPELYWTTRDAWITSLKTGRASMREEAESGEREKTATAIAMKHGSTIGEVVIMAERKGFRRGLEEAAKWRRENFIYGHSVAGQRYAEAQSDAILAIKD